MKEAIEVEAALRLALEALEECRRDPRLKYEHPTYDKTINAIKAVLEAHKALSAERVAQQSNEQIEPDWNDEQLKMLKFLDGCGDFNGRWFGEYHETEKGQFWWRKHLKRLFAHPPVPDAKLTAQPKEPEHSAPHGEPVAHCKVRPLRGDEFYPKTEIIWVKGRPVAGPLYTTPYVATPRPQRKPMTHEQAKALVAKYGNDPLNLIFQTEAAHGIKE